MKDLIIIGGGPAGLTAAIYAIRSGLEIAVIENFFFGGQAATTSEVENYPGFIKISGFELAQKLEAHARHFGTEFINEEVLEVNFEGAVKTIRTNANTYKAKAIIIATGAKPKKLDIPGEERFSGRGVSYCATCDGAFYRNKKVAVIGGGNTALEDAIYLSALCKEVYLIHRRDSFRGDASLVNRLKNYPNIITLMNSVAAEITGDSTVGGITVKPASLDGSASASVRQITLEGVFVAVGSAPTTALFTGKLKLDNEYIVTDSQMATSAAGIFAAGDVRISPLRQIITACADGAVASKSALDYIRQECLS